jgi:hypothetical protein
MSEKETMNLFFIEDLREIIEETADFKLTFDNAEMGCGVLLFRFYKENELTLSEYIEDVPDTILIPAEIEGFPVTRIDEKVFENGIMSKIVLPNTIMYIGPNAFQRCFLIEEMIIPDSVIEIGDAAFSGCLNLKKIEISRSVSSIGKGIFSGCPELKSIVVDPKNNHYDSRDNCNAVIDSYNNKLLFACRNTVIPQSVKTIEGAFNGCWSMKEFIIPNHIVEIGDEAFIRCEDLERIHIPNSVRRIGDYAFYGCSKLKELALPDSIEEIGENAFAFCESLKHVVIPFGLKVIPSGAFEFCSMLKEVVIPETVTTIGERAFSDTSIEELFIPKSVVAIGSPRSTYYSSSVFEGDNLFSIKVSTENKIYDSRNDCNAIIETASNTLIQGCNLTVIPNTVVQIAFCAFQGCKGINSLIIPRTVTTIGHEAFERCSGLQELVITENVTQIDSLAFAGCSPSSIIVSPANKVYDSRNDSNVIIETATNRLLLGNDKLTIPNTVFEISGRALCSHELKSLIVPDSVQLIDEDAFLDCNSLRQIVIKDPSLLKEAANGNFIKIVSPETAEFEEKSETTLESAINQIETDLAIDVDSNWDIKLLFSQKVIEVIRKKVDDDSKYEFSDFFNNLFVEIKNGVVLADPEKSMKNVFFNVLKHSYSYFSSLKFIKFLNIYNTVEKDEKERAEFYADFIHSLNGNRQLSVGKKLFSHESEDIERGDIDSAKSIMEMIFHGDEALNNMFEYSSSCASPIYSKMCYAIKCDANIIKYVYDDSLWGVFDSRYDWKELEGEFVNWLDSLVHRYDENNEVTNTICMTGCPWDNFSTKNEFEKYVLRAELGINIEKFMVRKEEIIIFLNQLHSFLFQVSSELINKIKDFQLHQTAVIASIAQVMARNMSHNIGSHVFSNLIGNDAYSKLTDKNILKAKVYVSPWDTEMEYPNGQVPFVKSHSGNFQLSYFNQYLKSRMDYLSEVTFGTPNMLTTKYIYSDVFKELDRVRILLNYISGIQGFKYTFCLKRNGVVLKNENDIAIAFPSDMLGNQAFYNIIENVIRNTAKHACNNKREVVTFTIEFTDVEDCSEYYCVEIDSGIEELDIDELVKKQNIRINTSVLDKDNNLRSHSLGLLEMEASAAFLRQVDIAKVDSYEYHFEDMDEYKNKYNNLILLKAINKNGALGYRFFVQKSKELLLVGNFDVADSKKDAVGKEGVLFISEDDFARAMGEGKSFAHPFLLYPNNVSDKIKILLSDDNDCKTLLPIRKLGLAQDEINEVVAIINGKGNIIPQLKEFAWKKHMQSMGIESGDIYIGEVVGRKRFSNCRQVVFANHGKNFETYWNNRTELPELWVDSLSSYRQGKLPSFACYSLAEDNTEEPLTRYVNTIPPQLKMEIFEAYHNKVVALDERIQRFSLESYEGSICASTLFNATNVIIPKTKLDPEQFDESMIHELEIFINNEINEINGAFLLVHYGILERMYKTEKAISEHLEAWAKKAKRVVVTSGRGSHSLQLPASVCFANLSSVLNAFTESRCKFLINSLINQSRRKNE